MTADDRWVPGHALILASTVLLTLGLWLAHRRQVWPPSVRRPLRLAAIATSLYVVEAAAHLGAVLDQDALVAGDAAPVAWTHVGLSSVLYPVTGWAIVYLAWHLGRASAGWRWALLGVGIVAGLAHALSVPLTILLPDAELQPRSSRAPRC